MKRIIIILIVFQIGPTTFGQKPIWKNILTERSEESVDFLIDSIGLLRLLTKNKLYTFDGTHLTEEHASTDSALYTCLVEKQYGVFLVGTLSGMIKEIDIRNKSTKEQHIFDASWPVSKIQFDKHTQTRIILSKGNGISITTADLDTLIVIGSPLIEDEINAFALQGAKLWLTTDNGLNKIHLKKNGLMVQSYDRRNGIVDVVCTQITNHENAIYFSDFNQNIQKFEPDQDVEIWSFQDRVKINDIQHYNNHLFVARDDGLYTLIANKWHKIYPNNGNASVRKVLNDREGNIYILDKEGKLYQGNLMFQKFPYQLNQVQGLEEVDDVIWIGNERGLFLQSKDETLQLNDQNITCIKNQDSIVWVGTYSNGLFLFHKSGKLLSTLRNWDQFNNLSILSITPFPSGALISSLSGVIYIDISITNLGQTFTMKARPALEGSVQIDYVYQTIIRNDSTYLATEGKGIKIIYQNQTTSFNNYSDGSEIGSVYSFTFDQQGKLWFSSLEGGLGCYHENIAYKVESASNVQFPYTSLIALPNQFLLMIHSNSVDLLNTETFEIYTNEKLNNHDPNESYLNVFHADNQKILFEHKKELFQFDWRWLQKTKPSLVFDRVLVNLQPIQSGIVLDQYENNIQFHFQGVWLTDSEKLSFRYKLDGYDADWRTTKDRLVNYPNLPPQKYSFLLSTTIMDLTAPGEKVTFDFEIKRKFYNRTWFLILAGILFFAALWKFWNIRKQKELRESEIETKHIEAQLIQLKKQLNPHFLFNSFNTLMGLIEEAPEKSLVFVEKLTDFYRIVLDHGKEQLVTFKKELKLISLYTDILNERFDGKIKLEISDFPDNMEIPPLTLQLLVENAVKHNQFDSKQKLVISISIDHQKIIIENNRFPKTYPVHSTKQGLENIKRRYEILGHGQIEIMQTAHTFKVFLPIIYSDQS